MIDNDSHRRLLRTALTIAGSDSGGGAGIQADLKTFAALGVYGTCAITAITAQNTVGVTAAVPLPADLVTAQIEAVASDIAVHATKIGMLGNAAIVEATAAAIAELELPLVVVDPVMVAKSGDALLDADGVRAIRNELLPRALVVTPNLPEAEALSDLTIRSINDAREAARRIHRLGPAVIIKGGHGTGEELVDLLFDGETFTELRTPRIATMNTHGTGCTFASAVAAHLALGHGLAEATARAQVYVAGAIRHGLAIGRGHGPLDHFWNVRRPESEAGADLPGDYRTSLY
jgi:hydroxymethylpyrimidine/phosphomethylpyrimidine kinase